MNKKYLFYLSTIMFFGVFFSLSSPVFGAQLGDAAGKLGEAGAKAGTKGVSDVGEVAGKGIGLALTLVGLVFLALMVYAGFLWMTARGDEGKVESAQKIVLETAIGLLLVISAYAIVKLVSSPF